MSLPPAHLRRYQRIGDATEFIIDEAFSVPGVGTVVAGTLKRGFITPNCTLLLGPDVGDGLFKPTGIKSIHYKRMPVPKVRGVGVGHNTCSAAKCCLKGHYCDK